LSVCVVQRRPHRMKGNIREGSAESCPHARHRRGRP
jgi:hypothetical protein